MVIVNGKEQTIAAEAIQVGMQGVKPGEKVPVDGKRVSVESYEHNVMPDW